jgi:hypothetical protein
MAVLDGDLDLALEAHGILQIVNVTGFIAAGISLVDGGAIA